MYTTTHSKVMQLLAQIPTSSSLACRLNLNLHRPVFLKVSSLRSKLGQVDLRPSIRDHQRQVKPAFKRVWRCINHRSGEREDYCLFRIGDKKCVKVHGGQVFVFVLIHGRGV